MCPVKRRIFDSSPETWEELELMVHQAFLEMGYESERGCLISTVRGKVKVDVYAKNLASPIPTIILCECKYWNRKVSQSTIHSFRTVCADAGAHYGLIISKKGFQSGAKEAKESTNVHLLNFEEFQDTYFGEWRNGVFVDIVKLRDSILPLVNPRLRTDENRKLFENFDTIKFTMENEMFYGVDYGVSEFFVKNEKFPIIINDPRRRSASKKKIEIKSHREYYEIAKEACSIMCKRFKMELPEPRYKM